MTKLPDAYLRKPQMSQQVGNTIPEAKKARFVTHPRNQNGLATICWD